MEFLGLRVLDDRIVIEPDELDDATPGGIFLPDTAKNNMTKTQLGTVLVVGPGKLNLTSGERAAVSVEPGAKVVYPKYQRQEVEIGIRILHIVSESDVLAVIPSVA